MGKITNIFRIRHHIYAQNSVNKEEKRIKSGKYLHVFVEREANNFRLNPHGSRGQKQRNAERGEAPIPLFIEKISGLRCALR
jgi:hypothetical protein